MPIYIYHTLDRAVYEIPDEGGVCRTVWVERQRASDYNVFPYSFVSPSLANRVRTNPIGRMRPHGEPEWFPVAPCECPRHQDQPAFHGRPERAR